MPFILNKGVSMEAIIYLLIFLMGAFFGSFFTLAVYRIPLGENITHKHSFCPNCHHKLGILDLFPIFSYLFLKGKCRYCKKPIRIRYFLLEILSGFTFLLLALSFHFDFYELEIAKLVYFVFTILYFCSLFIIAGIDLEKVTIQKSVLVYGLFVVTGYILYLYIVEQASIYRYVIYLFIMLLFVLLDTWLLKKKAQENYTLSIATLCFYIALFAGEQMLVLTIVYTLISIALYVLLEKIRNKKKNKRIDKSQIDSDMEKEEVESKPIPVGFFLCTTNIVLFILFNFVIEYMV